MLVYEPAKAAEQIPIVDLFEARSPDMSKRQAVARAIHNACRESGFFYVINHGVPAHVIQAQLAATRNFFAQPLDAKLEVSKDKSPILRGYEQSATQILDHGSPPDLKESFMVGRELAAGHWLLHSNVPFEGANLWPGALPGFREAVDVYTRHMVALGQTLASCVCLSLNLAEDHLSAGLDEPNCSVRMLRYPPQPTDAQFNQLGAGAHTDWGFLTILLQDEVGGLEVQSADQEWIRADPKPETFVINLGDMVPRFTNGLYASNLHRVLNNTSGNDRYSVATFFNPNGLFAFEVAPTCLRPGEPVAPPCSYADHIQQMFARSYRTASDAPPP